MLKRLQTYRHVANVAKAQVSVPTVQLPIPGQMQNDMLPFIKTISLAQLAKALVLRDGFSEKFDYRRQHIGWTRNKRNKLFNDELQKIDHHIPQHMLQKKLLVGKVLNNFTREGMKTYHSVMSFADQKDVVNLTKLCRHLPLVKIAIQQPMPLVNYDFKPSWLAKLFGSINCRANNLSVKELPRDANDDLQGYEIQMVLEVRGKEVNPAMQYAYQGSHKNEGDTVDVNRAVWLVGDVNRREDFTWTVIKIEDI